MSLESTQAEARFSVSQVTLHKKQRGSLTTASLQSRASLALALQCCGQEGEKRDSSIATEPLGLLMSLYPNIFGEEQARDAFVIAEAGHADRE